MFSFISKAFSSIKTYALAALAVALGIVTALWQYQRAKFKSAQLDGSEKARKTEKKAVETMIEGLEKEDEIKNDNSTNRDKFLD